ncbi:MAG: 50S ribosomal protein L11 methyltransferase [Acetivibrionales bacterium]|jgi:ribosomal protein L11 methyltransferase
MDWVEVKIVTTSEASDAVSQMLTEAGSGGVVIEDPADIRKEIEKPGSLDYADDEFLCKLGNDVIIKAYFPGSRNENELIEHINKNMGDIANYLDIGKATVNTSIVDDEDWANGWKRFYKPFHISDRIVVKPSWEKYISGSSNEVVIEIDPGMAFGTGTHDTTRMCAILLEKYMEEDNRVLDIGCGTGILSIVAAKLGATHVTAIDIDDNAVKVAKENCRLNGVGHLVDVYQGTVDSFCSDRYSIITANIIADAIIDMADMILSCIAAGGCFIASGIIKEREEEVVDKYTGLGFNTDTRLESGEWVAIVFRCRDFL